MYGHIRVTTIVLGSVEGERREVENFREVLNQWALRDLGYVGQWWTWERGKSVDTRIRERLDRFIASSSWAHLYSDASVEHLLYYNSGHSPILIKLQAAPSSSRRP